MRPILDQQLDAMREASQVEGINIFGAIADAYIDGLTTAYEMVPDHLAQVVSLAGDHVTFDTFGPLNARTPRLSVRHTELAARMPADSLVYAEIWDVGVTVHNAAS